MMGHVEPFMKITLIHNLCELRQMIIWNNFVNIKWEKFL